MPASPPSSPKPRKTVELAAEPVLLGLGTEADEPCLRADAARNRARLLEAATRLVAEHGAGAVTMEAVAAAASVGKGTVFRRFGDRTGLLMALLDHSEKKFQASFLSGPPPLGPGAPAVDRLNAFGIAVLRRWSEELELQLAAEPAAGRRFSLAPRRVHHRHLAMLLEQAAPGSDSELLAQTLMGYLDPALVHHLTGRCAMTGSRLEAGWTDLVTRLTRA
ncbi:TetR/AcrR family transcriptional regulator [Streptomyces sp. NPDC090306]|uniref:TetR/AcrR family transcriptional regulator n=1 Tax=unclassified Streptomyces TaxID=2593676 RepID=UPI0036E29475